MSGTEWTGPGKGATVGRLWRALGIGLETAAIRDRLYDLCSGNPAQRTNLRLTGAPLTAEDLDRIARAK